MLLEKYIRLHNIGGRKNNQEVRSIIYGDLGSGIRFENNSQEIVDVLYQTNDTARVLTLITLMQKEHHELPIAERKGLLCFHGLVMEADRVIDTQVLKGKPAIYIAKQILETPLLCSSHTISDLLDTTLQSFGPSKQMVVTDFIDDMVVYHSHVKPAVAGDYTFSDAMAYRKRTNNAWVEATYGLAEISDPTTTRLMQNLGMLVQYRDDRKDWPIDWVQHSHNLVIGMAAESDSRELGRMSAKVVEFLGMDTELSEMKASEWLKQHTPHTYDLYRSVYFDELKHIDDFSLRQLFRIKGI